MRDVATTAYAAKARRVRFGSHFHAELERLASGPRYSAESSRSRAEAYFDRWARRCAGYSDVTRFDDCPILTKATYWARPGAFVPSGGADGASIHRTTSGTTGRPLIVPTTIRALQEDNAFVWDHRRWHGCPFGTRTATLGSHPVTPMTQDDPPFWARNYLDHQLIFSSYHLSERNGAAYAAALRRFEPALVHGFSSSVAAAARYCETHGVRLQPRAVITSSEVLHEHQRSLIQRVFGRQVFTYYGNVEGAGHVSECEAGRLHIREDHSFVEILDEAGSPTAPGTPGRLVATAFRNTATCLVRYDTGDIATLSASTDCTCGRPGRILDSIEGRENDWVIDGDGHRISSPSLSLVFVALPLLSEGQIVQSVPGHLEIRVVCSETELPAVEAALREALTRRMSPSTTVTVTRVEQLERTAGGKTSLVLRKTT